MTDTKENIMGTLPIGKLLMKMSVPVILSMLVSTLYGVIDSIFVSRLGDNALTAMSLATTISSLIACITVGFSVGMNAELSKSSVRATLTAQTRQQETEYSSTGSWQAYSSSSGCSLCR